MDAPPARVAPSETAEAALATYRQTGDRRIRNRVVEFETDSRIAWRHFTANRWRYELAPTADGGTTVTETFDDSRADGITDAVVRWAKFPERNRQGIVDTLQRLKRAAEADAKL